jgi:hypothetical protein
MLLPFKGLRWIEERDRDEIFETFLLAYEENGWGGIDHNVVRDVIDKAIRRESYPIVLTRGPQRIEAALGLQPNRMWYGDAASWWYSDLLVYVHPEHRRSRHFATLMRFARWFEEGVRTPVLLGVMAKEDQERKAKAYARYGRPVAQTFLIGSGTFRYMDRAPADAGDQSQ